MKRMKMTNHVDVVRMCIDIAKEFPLTASDVLHIYTDIVLEKGYASEEEVRERCREESRMEWINGVRNQNF